MADPRFYDNRGPFTLAEVCVSAGTRLPPGADGSARILDLASLTGASSEHLTFFSGGGTTRVAELSQSRAGFCFITASVTMPMHLRIGLTSIPCESVQHAFASTAQLFYPESSLVVWSQKVRVNSSAAIGARVELGPGVVVGPGVEIGEGTRVGPNSVVGRGVAIGRNCEIGSNCTITNSYLGDEVLVLPGAQIGQPGFGFASSALGHVKVPQLGRVIIQDRVEVGACTTIDRGALGDTIIGEGTKIDNLVQIGHNTRLGRHGIVVGQVGISGSCDLGDFVILGGQVGIGDHTRIGTGARMAARAATAPGSEYDGAQDYGGQPAKPVREWIREIHTLTNLAKRPKQSGNG